MTPSNPSNSKPLIYRICDSLGIFHLVAPVNHTHAQSEVEGLESALAGKAPLNHSHDSISSDENNSVSVSDGVVTIELNDGETGGKLDIPVKKLGNLQRAINNPDSTPIANSDNLVTSGGVKAALDEKMGIMSFDSVPTAGSNNLVKSGKIREALQYEGKINPMTINESLGSQAIENIVPWYSDGCVELHYLLMKTDGSAIPIKNLFHSNTCQTYYADDLGDLTTTRWAAITIRKTVTGASTPVCVITLDGVITPS